ncbi:murein transglycosylase A [Nitrosomonas marina]|uniref:peptidoglycan lytic exotransglycosylase n=1 Tax=Nitrosomonas marina TaxID=917 RepID=A0A1H8CQK3_9PROT|nr:MltA domain-containing protein [Nitrosomonas marina]SEM96714.1 membrane-bound lytic murein transglycosylase A [Nitrosomonas marina]
MKNQSCFSIILILLVLLAGCTSKITESPGTVKQTGKPEINQPDETRPSTYVAAHWSNLPGWYEDDLYSAWQAFKQSCSVLRHQLIWQEVCIAASNMQATDSKSLRIFFEKQFTPYQVIASNGSKEGLVTGYYEPLLHGSRQPSEYYRYPVYGAPDELLTIDLGSLYPELKDLRLRGRLDGRRVVPYYSRAEIMSDPTILEGHELFWVNDEIELFFLQIQGSGRILLESGEIVKVGFADQNGYPYNSIGRILVQQGELPMEKASMQGIKQWGQLNPDKLPSLLQQNARFIFFRELPEDLSGPVGALGVPLTAGRSIAIDPQSIPQGAPVFLATTWPNTDRPLNRLMVAQDTGNAIKGGIRVDFFWGHGPEAASQAGRMKQQGSIWVLMPNNHTVPQLAQQ